MNKPECLCDRCDHYARCLLNYDGPACRKTRTTQPTNADHIRAMTDEELAKWLSKMGCLYPDRYDCKSSCKEGLCWLSWLRQEAE